MKITVLKTDVKEKIIYIVNAKALGNYTIQIEFNDGVERFVNFFSFLTNSQHKSIKKYLNEELFNSFSIIDGNLIWQDYEMIFPLADLYEGKI